MCAVRDGNRLDRHHSVDGRNDAHGSADVVGTEPRKVPDVVEAERVSGAIATVCANRDGLSGETKSNATAAPARGLPSSPMTVPVTSYSAPRSGLGGGGAGGAVGVVVPPPHAMVAESTANASDFVSCMGGRPLNAS